MSNTLLNGKFDFMGMKSVYNGKVRDVFTFENDLLAMVVSDRISAFDVILPRAIPYKGQVLNQIAAKMLENTEDIVPNWVEAVPDPNVTIGKACTPFKVEMVVRNYLVGHAWREYKSGKRSICGVALKDGMIENQKFDKPIITPTTKADQGDHDADISKEDIIKKGIVSISDYEILEDMTYALFERGQELAEDKGLILVDTKYEFGKSSDGQIVLIDEIHTPDSSRYFYADSYKENFEKGLAQKQLSKEFVREWLMENNFQGKPGQVMPEMTDEVVESISNRYIELYELIIGEEFEKADLDNINERITENVNEYLESRD
jgi:phosphoribosylaminoimidazole-succinocarboxamide synthase